MKDPSDRIIYALLLMVGACIGASFFLDPKYEKGVWVMFQLVSNALTGMMGFKFGVHVPKVDPPVNGSQETTVVSKVETKEGV